MQTIKQLTLQPLVLALSFLCASSTLHSAAWNYRGSLQDAGTEANGKYDFRLTLVSASGQALAPPITLYGVAVEKGSFAAAVDFGVDPKSFPDAKIRSEVQQGASGFFTLGEKVVAGGAAECWDVDGNTAVTAFKLGVTDSSAATLNITNGSGDLYLRQNAGIEQDGSGAFGVSSAAWNTSRAEALNSFSVGRGIVGPLGIASFAFSDITPATAGGTPGYSNAPGEFLVRSAGGVAFNTVPSDSDFAIGTRPGQADTDTLLHFDSNARTAKFGLLANGQTGIQAPLNLFLQATTGVGINAQTADLSSFIDLAIRPKSSGADGDVDIALISRDGTKTTTFVNDQESGTFFITTTPTAGSPRLNMNGATLSNGGVWTNQSSRTLKEGFASVDSMDILRKVAALPITTWTYKRSAEGLHMGPVAEDFKAAFGLAGDGKSIGTVDADGVALAAIQGLNQKLESENAALKARLEAIEAKLAD
jgi:hypothetical protein